MEHFKFHLITAKQPNVRADGLAGDSGAVALVEAVVEADVIATARSLEAWQTAVTTQTHSVTAVTTQTHSVTAVITQTQCHSWHHTNTQGHSCHHTNTVSQLSSHKHSVTAGITQTHNVLNTVILLIISIKLLHIYIAWTIGIILLKN